MLLPERFRFYFFFIVILPVSFNIRLYSHYFIAFLRERIMNCLCCFPSFIVSCFLPFLFHSSPEFCFGFFFFCAIRRVVNTIFYSLFRSFYLQINLWLSFTKKQFVLHDKQKKKKRKKIAKMPLLPMSVDLYSFYR